MSHKLLAVVALLITISYQLSMSVNPTNMLINVNTSYAIAVDRSSQNNTVFPLDGIVTIQFTNASYTTGQMAGISCIPPCTLTGTTLKFNSSSFSNAAKNLSMSVSGVVNPPTTSAPGDFTYTLLNSTGGTVETVSTRIASFTPGQFKSCIMTFSPNTLRTNGTATFQLSPGNPILVGSKLSITVPFKWSQSLGTDKVVPSNTSLNCSSNNSALMSPTCSTDSVGGSISIGTFSAKSTVSTFWVTVSMVLSPMIPYAESTVGVASVDSLGETTDDTTTCTIVPPPANTLQLSVNTVGMMVGAVSAPVLSFTSTDLVMPGDVLKITFLSSLIQPNNFGVVAMLVNDSGMSMLGYSSSTNLSTQYTNTTARSYGYLLSKLTGRSSVGIGSLFQLSNLTITGPPNTQTFQAFNVSIYRTGYIFCTGTVSMSMSANSLINQSVTADNALINAQTTYTLNFTTSSALSSQSRLQVVIPSDIFAASYASKICRSVIVNSLTGSGNCSVTTNILTVTGLFYDGMPASSNVSIRFDGITNPGTSKPTSAFTITTYYDSTNNKTDQSQSLVFTAKADTISSCTVSRNNDTVGASATYTFVYTVKNSLPKTAYLLIGLPAEITLPTTPLSASVNGTSVLSSNSTVNSIQQVNLTAPFTDVITSASVLTIVLKNLTNPASTSPSSSFSVSAYNAGSLIEGLSSGLATGQSSPNTFSTASITPNNSINGQPSKYTLLFKPSIDYSSGRKLVLAIPAEVGLSSPSCTSALLTVSCTIIGGNLQITVNSSLISTQNYSIVIDGFTNPRTYSTSGTFTLTSYLSDLSAKIDNVTIPGITNTLPNAIKSLSFTVSSPSQSYMVSNQTLQFKINTTNALSSTDYIQLTYPTEYTFVGTGNSSVCSEMLYNCIPTSGNANKLKITSSNFGQLSSFTFSIFNYQSPKATTSSIFQVNTFETNGNPIDKFDSSNNSTSVSFTITCMMPCQTCQTSNKSSCLSCYKDTTITTEVNYQSSGQCVNQCGSGFYPQGNLAVCTSCPLPCATCRNSTFCYSCSNISSNMLKSYDPVTSTCVVACPFKYYSNWTSNGYVCAACSTAVNCLTCSNSDINCTSCVTGTVLYSNQCLTVGCPSGYYANSTGVCVTCNPSCSTCSNESNICLTCSSAYSRLYPSGPCVISCGTNNVSLAGQCLCQGNCSTCSVTTTNCTSCSNLNFYLNLTTGKRGQCLQTCPDGTFSQNSVCISCSTGCTQCTSSLVCLRCTGTYSLSIGLCVSTCPTGTYSINNLCSNCSNQCLSCNGTAINCTSCLSPLGLMNSTCVTNCNNITNMVQVSTKDGLVCQSCDTTCMTCSVLPTNCTACTGNLSHYGSQCKQKCPSTTYSLNNTCIPCVSPCSTCQNNSTCLSCIFNTTANSTYYTVKTSTSVVRCITNCTVLSLYINGTECITCQSPCKSCNSTAVECLECMPGYILQKSSCVQNCSAYFYRYNDQCLAACPENMTSYDGVCGAVPVPTPPVVVPEKTVPVPFTIAAVVALVCVGVSYKITNGVSNIPAMSVALLSILETLSWLVTAILTGLALPNGQRLLKAGVWLITSGLIFHLLNNLLAIYFGVRYYVPDYEFSKWLKGRSKCGRLGIVIACIFNHKFFNLFFSRAFGFATLSASLTHNVLFTPMNIVTGLAFVPQVIMIVGCALAAADSTTSNTSQLYLSIIDSIVLAVMTVVFSIWSFKRPPQVQAGDHSLAKRYQAREESGQSNNTVEAMNTHEIVEELIAEPGRAPTYVARNTKYDSNPHNKLLKPGLRAGAAYVNPIENGGLHMLSRRQQTEQEINFSESSSEFVSEVSEGKELKVEEVATNVVRVKPSSPSKHRMPVDEDMQDAAEPSEKPQSIVEKLASSEPSDNEANAVTQIHPEDEQPAKPDIARIAVDNRIQLIHKDDIDYEDISNLEGEATTQHNKTISGFAIDRRFDLEVEDITDDMEQDMPRMPSFQGGLKRENKVALSGKRQRVSSIAHMNDRKRPIDTSTIVLHGTSSPEKVPAKPKIGKADSDIDFDRTRSYSKENTALNIEDSYGNDMGVSPSLFNAHNQRYEPEPSYDHIKETDKQLGQPHGKFTRSQIAFRPTKDHHELRESIVEEGYQQILPPENIQPIPIEFIEPQSNNQVESRRGRAENELGSSKVRSLQRIYLNKLQPKKGHQDRRNKLPEDR